MALHAAVPVRREVTQASRDRRGCAIAAPIAQAARSGPHGSMPTIAQMADSPIPTKGRGTALIAKPPIRARLATTSTASPNAGRTTPTKDCAARARLKTPRVAATTTYADRGHPKRPVASGATTEVTTRVAIAKKEGGSARLAGAFRDLTGHSSPLLRRTSNI